MTVLFRLFTPHLTGVICLSQAVEIHNVYHTDGPKQ